MATLIAAKDGHFSPGTDTSHRQWPLSPLWAGALSHTIIIDVFWISNGLYLGLHLPNIFSRYFLSPYSASCTVTARVGPMDILIYRWCSGHRFDRQLGRGIGLLYDPHFNRFDSSTHMTNGRTDRRTDGWYSTLCIHVAHQKITLAAFAQSFDGTLSVIRLQFMVTVC